MTNLILSGAFYFAAYHLVRLVYDLLSPLDRKELIQVFPSLVAVSIAVAAILNARWVFRKQQKAQRLAFGSQQEAISKAFLQDRAREFITQCKNFAQEWIIFSRLENLAVPTTNFHDWLSVLLNETIILKEAVAIYLNGNARLLQLIEEYQDQMKSSFESKINSPPFVRIFNPNRVETYALMPGNMINEWQGSVAFAGRFFVFRVTGEVQRIMLGERASSVNDL